MVWLYTTLQGTVFIICHMMVICLQATMVMKVFYKVPNKLGYFELTADSNIVTNESMKEMGAEDDSYKAA
jgi:hypothetical protein